MNTKLLANHYDQLTIWERVPLRIAAEARGDDLEAQRLLDSAPTKRWYLPNHLMAEQALNVLALIYITEQLDAAAAYFFAMWQMDDAPQDWSFSADASAYFFSANAEAWRRFCAGLSIDPNALTATNYRGTFLSFCEERMPAQAPTRDELQERIRNRGRDKANLVTADSLLASWRGLLKNLTGHTAAFGEEES